MDLKNLHLPWSSGPKNDPTKTPPPPAPGTLLTLQDALSPAEMEVDFSFLRFGRSLDDKKNSLYVRTFFASAYPRFVEPNWLDPLISFEHSLTISMFIYPSMNKGVLDDLKRKIAEMEATIQTDLERGREVDPAVQVALDDARALQEQLVKGTERFFQFSLYMSVPANSIEDLDNTSKLVQSTLGSLSITVRPTTLQMEQGYNSSLPLASDELLLTHNMDTTSLATTFPFTSSSLTSKQGILYGLNAHNGSLVIFDRFEQENANMVVFAKSGSGKSYMVKLETIRSLMLGIEVMVIDPEREYEKLAAAVGGDYINFSTNSAVKINPFDLSQIANPDEDELGRKILTLTGFLKLVLGELNPSEAALLDRSLTMTYKQKGITTDPKTQTKTPPLMEDLYKVLIGMEDPLALSLASRLERFIKGSLSGIFSSHSNLNIKNNFTVFSVRDLPDQLRPLAMYLILDYVWTRIRMDLKKRILVVDEAWYMMKNPDSASFLVEMAKRARKYYLGLTTITQDVEDFLGEDRGKEIIANSSVQVLLKQAPASIDRIGEVFNLSQGEKRLLLTAGVGQGLFFAGSTHVAMRVVASDDEHVLITTNPNEMSRG